jgi:2,3-bisphosphoglycerate-independent phosphoglycerate mutase
MCMKALILIRDGWGHGKNYKGNAIEKANTPNHDRLTATYPTTTLACTGNAVGNPEGVQGGSEVGHLTIGAGRIVWQPYELINQKIRTGEFFKNKELLAAIDHCKKQGSSLHLDGLFSTQGVHADYKHLFALLELCKQQDFNDVFIHLTLDGRDMPERSALPMVKELESKIRELGTGTIASVIGRYYAMDRDKNWDRTRKAYDMLIEGKGYRANSASEAINQGYERGESTDYYIRATIIEKEDKPIALLKDKDAMIWYNFRTDRSRQITAMIKKLDYCPKEELPAKPIDVHYTCFSSYDSNWVLPVCFLQEKVSNNLGYAISKKGLRQLRIAETEKYAHVTFFFNSQVETPYDKESRIMVNSPKVKSYDLQPEMCAYEVTEKVLDEIGRHDLIVLNYANPDLVGHSGVFDAVVKACEVVDDCVGKVVDKAQSQDYAIFLMADHGNADHMVYDDGSADPSHGFAPITLTLISDKHKGCRLLQGCGLKDVAPTVMEVMGLKKPDEMTGKSLIVHS